MNIEWYPGHIAKARREIKEHLKEIDIVIEIIDARCPLSSIDFLNDEIDNKKRLIVINKADLVEKADLKNAEQRIKDLNITNDYDILFIDSRDNTIKKLVDKKIDKLCLELYKKNEKRGLKDYKIRAMVVGAPNVGKSTFINSYIKKKVNKVENTPGVTKKLNWAKVSDKVLLLDTPGVTIKKFTNNDFGINLALVGSINDDILEKQELCFEFLKKCYKKYSVLFIKRYKIDDINDESNVIDVMNKIAMKFHYIKKNGDIDYEKTANLIINDFRHGKIGKICLE